jgi:hypothetical protein
LLSAFAKPPRYADEMLPADFETTFIAQVDGRRPEVRLAASTMYEASMNGNAAVFAKQLAAAAPPIEGFGDLGLEVWLTHLLTEFGPAVQHHVMHTPGGSALTDWYGVVNPNTQHAETMSVINRVEAALDPGA